MRIHLSKCVTWWTPSFPSILARGKVETWIRTSRHFFWRPFSISNPINFRATRIGRRSISTLIIDQNSFNSSPPSHKLFYDSHQFPLVNDYHTIYPPEKRFEFYSFNECSHEERFKTYFLKEVNHQNKRICFLKKLRNLFTLHDLSRLVHEFKTTPPLGQDLLGRSIFISNQLKLEKVKFDNGKIAHSSLSQCSYYKHSSALIQKATRRVLERFGQEMGCKNEEIKAVCSAIKYHLIPEKLEGNPIPWHIDSVLEDENYRYADYTMLILLSNPSGLKGWTGGNVLYTGRREIEWFSELDELKKKTSNFISNHPKFPIWEITPTTNDAILLGNLGMNHCITPIKPNSNQGERIVFTLFVNMK